MSRFNNDFKDEYNKTKREYDKMVVYHRKGIYSEKILQSDNKNKMMWAICNEINGKENNKIDCAIPGAPEKIANEYNTNIVPNLNTLNTSDLSDFQSNIKENDYSIH